MLVAGVPVMSCLLLATGVRGAVTTIEGLAEQR
jgi:aerobic-type carbon monoxide dehydrogenase small subunit (CoxS/CutS family)